MEKNNKIFIWSPFTSKVGTVKNVVNFTSGLADYSKKKQFNISFINSFGEWNYLKKELEDKKFNFFDFFYSNKFLKWKKDGFIKSRLFYIIIFLVSFFPLIKLLRNEKPKYLFCYLITSLPLTLFFLFRFETKLVLSIAGQPRLNFLRKIFWKMVSKRVSYVICPSNELKTNLTNLHIFKNEKIFVIQDPHLSIKKINILKSEIIKDDYFKNNKIIISIGRLTKQKNFTFLINNFSEIRKKYNNFKLVIIGDGEEREMLLRLIKKLDLEDHVNIYEYKENIYNYLNSSNYYVSTSEWEGSSLAMIDAAVIGIPILCSDCPTGRKEFIGEDERGYLYLQNNSKDFLSKFDKMINEEAKFLSKKLVKAKKLIKKFTNFNHFLNFKKNILKEI